MRRYQCIKNVTTSQTGDMRFFTAGKVYSLTEYHSHDELQDDFGSQQVVNKWLLSHFQELLDLHIDEQEVDTYRMPVPNKRISLGISILIAVILTVLALIFLR